MHLPTQIPKCAKDPFLRVHLTGASELWLCAGMVELVLVAAELQEKKESCEHVLSTVETTAKLREFASHS
jgi:hypothetical protein